MCKKYGRRSPPNTHVHNFLPIAIYPQFILYQCLEIVNSQYIPLRRKIKRFLIRKAFLRVFFGTCQTSCSCVILYRRHISWCGHYTLSSRTTILAACHDILFSFPGYFCQISLIMFFHLIIFSSVCFRVNVLGRALQSSASTGERRNDLTLSQTTYFRLFQTERICRRQFQI